MEPRKTERVSADNQVTWAVAAAYLGAFGALVGVCILVAFVTGIVGPNPLL